METNLGKCHVWHRRGGEAPEGVEDLGETVWRGNRAEAERGLLVLGTPLGAEAYVAAQAEVRISEERRLLQWLPKLPDLQCSWLLLLLCAVPRANHWLRTVPPTMLEGYARQHDDAL